jgi:hypothetical protein
MQLAWRIFCCPLHWYIFIKYVSSMIERPIKKTPVVADFFQATSRGFILYCYGDLHKNKTKFYSCSFFSLAGLWLGPMITKGSLSSACCSPTISGSRLEFKRVPSRIFLLSIKLHFYRGSGWRGGGGPGKLGGSLAFVADRSFARFAKLLK